MNLGKHGVELFHRGPFSVTLTPPLLDAPRPKLKAAAQLWLTEQQQPRESDLQPNRVGVFRPSYSAGMCTLLASPASWAEFQVLRDPKRRAMIPIAERFWILAVTCLVVSSDDYFILGFRSRQVSTSANLWSVTAAGYVDADRLAADGSQDGPNDLCSSILSELEEEAGLGLADLTALPETLGLCIHPPREHVWLEGAFLARSILYAEEILSRARNAKDSWENKHSALTREDATQLVETTPMHPPAAVNLGLALNLL